MFILGLIPIWSGWSFWYEFYSAKKELISLVETWSEDLSLAYLSKTSQILDQRIYKKISHHKKFEVLSFLNKVNGSEISNSSYQTISIPIKLYNIPAGNLYFKPKLFQIFVASLVSSRFIFGLLLLGLIGLSALYGVTHLQLINEQKLAIENQIQFKNTLTRHILHDLKSPLTLLRSLAQSDSQKLSLTEYQNYIRILDHRFNNLIKQFELNNYSELKATILSQDQITDHLESISKQISQQTKVEIQMSMKHDKLRGQIQLLLDPFLRAFQNLLLNACEATIKNHNHQVWVTTEISDERISILIEDQGPGFSGPNYQFSHNKSSNVGRGIGLYSVRECVHLLGGSLHFRPLNPIGTKTELIVPIVTFA